MTAVPPRLPSPSAFPVPATLAPMAEHILGVAGRLFYANGIHATGVDRIVREADIAKMSLYKHFPAKEDLVLAFLARRDERWCAWLTARVTALSGDAANVQPLESIFTALGEWFSSEDFRGCAFINASVEYAEATHLARRAAAEHKLRVRRYLSGLCRNAGLSPSAEAAAQLALVIEGAIVTAQMGEPLEAASRALAVARAVIQTFQPPTHMPS